jgi:beta-mannosidase
MVTVHLNREWSVLPEDFSCIGEAGLGRVRHQREGWLPAQVPGEIHLDLMRAGQMPDPVLGIHMPECHWPETKSWWYRTTLDLDEQSLQHERLRLIFDGLDLYAQVFVNDRLVGESANALVPSEFDVQPFVTAGRNQVVVRLTVGSELARDETLPGQGKEWRPNSAAAGAIPNPMREGDLYGHRNWNGRKWLRKPQFSYGWDWVDALPNIGIWRGVCLEGRSYAVVQDLRLDTLRQDGRVYLEMAAVVENLHPWSERTCVFELDIQPPVGGALLHRQYSINALPGRTALRDVIEIPDARLWWPNGMGDQPLYQVTARTRDAAGAICDQRQFAIGLRTIEIDRSPLAEGSRFCLRVNGQDVFCRGVNIGPHDAILARITDQKYERLVAEAQHAHVNMIRINGCSIFEPPVFYEACDRAGILVWHDFLLTDTSYPEQDDAFCSAVRAEVETAIRLLRHHPSIALWCGSNECSWLFEMWNTDRSLPLDTGGQKFYYQLFPDVCRQLDPHRPYWPNSPLGGETPNSELAGNCHWWFPFFMNPDINRRIRHEVFDECRARFVTEYGVIGPCHLDSIHEYLSAEQRQPASKAWQKHTNTFEKETVPAAIRLHYASPEKLAVPDYVLYGGMFQAIIHGHAMEALRFRKCDPVDDCQGALIWSYSDCWGETGWSILDYYLRRKASYYWFSRACAPLKVIVRQRGEHLVTRIVNDTLQSFTGRVAFGWWRLDGSSWDVETKPVSVLANGMLEVNMAPLLPASERDPRQWLYAAVLYAEDGLAFDQSIWLLLPHRELALAAPEIKINPRSDGGLEVSSPVYCHGVHVEDHGREVISDNWFDLLPGIPKLIQAVAGYQPGEMEFTAVVGEPHHT